MEFSFWSGTSEKSNLIISPRNQAVSTCSVTRAFTKTQSMLKVAQTERIVIGAATMLSDIISSIVAGTTLTTSRFLAKIELHLPKDQSREYEEMKNVCMLQSSCVYIGSRMRFFCYEYRSLVLLLGLRALPYPLPKCPLEKKKVTCIFRSPLGTRRLQIHRPAMIC